MYILYIILSIAFNKVIIISSSIHLLFHFSQHPMTPGSEIRYKDKLSYLII